MIEIINQKKQILEPKFLGKTDQEFIFLGKTEQEKWSGTLVPVPVPVPSSSRSIFKYKGFEPNNSFDLKSSEAQCTQVLIPKEIYSLVPVPIPALVSDFGFPVPKTMQATTKYSGTETLILK